jgi:hypothetical protein
MIFGDGFEQSDDPSRPAGLPDAVLSSATSWDHCESQLVDAREAELLVFHCSRTSTARLGAVREVAILVPRVRAEHHPPHWPRRADAGDHAKLGAERETILVEAGGRGTRSHER